MLLIAAPVDVVRMMSVEVISLEEETMEDGKSVEEMLVVVDVFGECVSPALFLQ